VFKKLFCNHYDENEYYGNYNDYEVKFILLSKLEDYLETL